MFADACLAAAYPDGKKALREAQAALHGISSALQTNLQFWQATCQVLEGYLADYNRNDFPILSIGRTQKLAKCWEGYQTSLNDAIASIAKSSDAFTVDAIGASPSRNSSLSTQAGQQPRSPPRKLRKAPPPPSSSNLAPRQGLTPSRLHPGKSVTDSNVGDLDV